MFVYTFLLPAFFVFVDFNFSESAEASGDGEPGRSKFVKIWAGGIVSSKGIWLIYGGLKMCSPLVRTSRYS